MSKATFVTYFAATVLDATMFALVGIVILCGLGVWQLDRKVWKEDLIARLNARLSRAPQDLPPRASWPQLHQDGEEFRRVVFPAEFLDGEEALIYTRRLGALRPDVKGPKVTGCFCAGNGLPAAAS